jgi:hypothetical protein
MTGAQLCNHFEQRELGSTNLWRSYATKKCYGVYLRRWIVPQWGDYELGNVKTIEVESWLRRFHLAKSSCANLMSVLFNHACRYEFFDHNPISLSDLDKTDPNIHDGTAEGVMCELGNAFVRRGPQPTVPEMMHTYRQVHRKLDEILTNAGTKSLFEARIFKDLCFAAKVNATHERVSGTC